MSNFVNKMTSFCTSNALDLASVANIELLKKLVCVKGFATQIARSMSTTAEILDKFIKFIRKSSFSLSQLRMCTCFQQGNQITFRFAHFYLCVSDFLHI